MGITLQEMITYPTMGKNHGLNSVLGSDMLVPGGVYHPFCCEDHKPLRRHIETSILDPFELTYLGI